MPLTCFVTKVLLEHSHTFMYILFWLLSLYKGGKFASEIIWHRIKYLLCETQKMSIGFPECGRYLLQEKGRYGLWGVGVRPRDRWPLDWTELGFVWCSSYLFFFPRRLPRIVSLLSLPLTTFHVHVCTHTVSHEAFLSWFTAFMCQMLTASSPIYP